MFAGVPASEGGSGAWHLSESMAAHWFFFALFSPMLLHNSETAIKKLCAALFLQCTQDKSAGLAALGTRHFWISAATESWCSMISRCCLPWHQSTAKPVPLLEPELTQVVPQHNLSYKSAFMDKHRPFTQTEWVLQRLHHCHTKIQGSCFSQIIV